MSEPARRPRWDLAMSVEQSLVFFANHSPIVRTLKTLDEVSALPSEYPGWMLSFQGQARAKRPHKE